MAPVPVRRGGWHTAGTGTPVTAGARHRLAQHHFGWRERRGPGPMVARCIAHGGRPPRPSAGCAPGDGQDPARALRRRPRPGRGPSTGTRCAAYRRGYFSRPGVPAHNVPKPAPSTYSPKGSAGGTPPAHPPVRLHLGRRERRATWSVTPRVRSCTGAAITPAHHPVGSQGKWRGASRIEWRDRRKDLGPSTMSAAPATGRAAWQGEFRAGRSAGGRVRWSGRSARGKQRCGRGVRGRH